MQSCHRAVTKLYRTGVLTVKPNPYTVRYFSNEETDKIKDREFSNNELEIKKKIELSGFAKSYTKFAEAALETSNESVMPFAHLLRNSNFIDLGDPEGKVVPGRIFHIVGDDLYIDFGFKFHCVCPRPLKNASDYVRGSLVRVRIKDLELSTKFLGTTKDLTILEADCTLTSLISTPMKNVSNV